jgi:hypothetical protein
MLKRGMLQVVRPRARLYPGIADCHSADLPPKVPSLLEPAPHELQRLLDDLG